MANDYALRMYTPADKAQIFSLMRAVWDEQVAETAIQTWDWKQDHNPHLPPGSMPAVYILEHNQTVVGLFSTIYMRATIAGESAAAVWGVDFAVHPEHRGRGIRLIKYAMEQTNAVQFGTPFGRAYELEIRIGCEDVVGLDNYKCIVSPYHYFSSKPKLKPLAPLLACGWQLLNMVFKLRRPRLKPGMSMRLIERFGESHTALWQQIAVSCEIAVVRDATYMNWRYCDCPHKHYACYEAVQEGVVKGVVVVGVGQSEGLRIGHIVDFLVADADSRLLGAMVRFVYNTLRKQKVHHLTCSIGPAQSNFVPVLRRSGFILHNPGLRVVLGTGTHHKEKLMALKQWYLTRGDSDMDM